MARLEVGRIARPHGLRGEVVVTLLTNRAERIAPGAVLYAGDRALRVDASRPHKGGWIVAFDGILDRTAAEAVHGAVLAADEIADDDALWVHQLIGSRVVDQHGVDRGAVESVQDNPASDLLVLDTGALVPLTFVVTSVAGVITVDAPEGLFDL